MIARFFLVIPIHTLPEAVCFIVHIARFPCAQYEYGMARLRLHFAFSGVSHMSTSDKVEQKLCVSVQEFH